MKTKLNTLLQYVGIVALIILFMSANKYSPKYSLYQIKVWELKANEGYEPWWYPDGNGHSIGFGWNDCAGKRRHEIRKYTKDGKVTYDEATEITLNEIQKYGTLNSDPWKNTALQLYSYNCGLTKSGARLGKCCGGRWMCGSRNLDIRKSHSRRRKFELALWNKDFDYIYKETEKNQRKIVQHIIPKKS